MVPKQKSKFRRKIFRGATFGLTCLLGALLGIYLARIQIARHFAEKALSQTSIIESRFNWDRLDTDLCSFSDVFIRSDSYTMSIEQIDLSYDLTEAWKERKLKTLKIRGLQLYYDLTGPSTVDLEEVDTLIKTGIPFPLHSVAIENANVRLLTDFGETNIDLDLELRQADMSEIQGEVKAKTKNETVQLEVAISDRIRVTVQASTSDLADTLAANGIEWRDKLPLTRKDAINLSDANINASIVFNGIGLESALISAKTGPLTFRDFDSEIEIESVHASFELLGTEIRNAESSIHLKRFLFDPVTVSETNIQATVSQPNNISVTIPDTTWESTNGEKGVVSAKINSVLNDHYEIESYSGEFSVKELRSDSLDLSPFEIAFEGTLASIAFSFGDLVNQAMPWLTVGNMGANVDGLDSETPEVLVTAQIVAEEPDDPDKDTPFSGAWKLDANLFPGSLPKRASLTLKPLENRPLFVSSIATLNGTASLQADFDYWPEEREVSLKLHATAADLMTNYADWGIQGSTASIVLATQPIDLIRLGDLRHSVPALIEFVAPLTEYKIDLQGSEIKGPFDLTVQWFSAGFHSNDSLSTKPIQAQIELGAGIVQLGTEVINQFTLNSDISGFYDLLDTKTRATLLFENEPVSINLAQSLKEFSSELKSEGEYAIEGINLVSSDLLSRHLPELKGSSVSAKIDLRGQTHLIGEEWDASAKVQLREGSLRLPSQELSVDTIQADLSFPSLVSLSTEPSQMFSANRISIGDIEATEFQSEFMLTEGNRLSVEKAGLSIFEGRVTIDPFTLSLEDPNANLLLRFNRLSITPAIAMLDFFDGQVSGRLNGTLPIGIKNGYPVLGEGFLELDPSEAARFSYNASGFFTEKGAQVGTKKTLGDKLLDRLGLEPNALLEDALGNLSIQKLRLDLFNKNLPSTPMRIELAGIADTGQAQIPLNITTNVNGTVAELLNFLTRLDSLGLVASQTPVQPGSSDSNNL